MAESRAEKRIGDLLVEAGVVTRDDIEGLLKKKPQVADRRLVSELYAAGLATERKLADVLARRLGSPVAVLTESVIDLDVVNLVPPDIMLRHLALPVAADERTITIVTPDPDDPALTVPLGFATGRRVVLLIGIHSVLKQTIEAALAGKKRGDKVVVGKNAAVASPHLEVARDAPAVSLEEANRIARAMIEALADGPKRPVDDWEPPSNATRIGAIRLKHMLVERPKEALPEIVEKPLVIRDEGAADLAELDAVDLEEVGEGQPVALVVDDDDAIRKMLVVALQHDGLTVLEAKTGEEAVTMLRLARPDVVLLDVQLPVISGLEICSSLKKSQHKDVPVIMVSGVHKGLEQAREIVEVYGADHFVEKPFEVTFVRRLVGDLLKRPHAPHPAVDSGLVDDVRRRYDEHAAAGLWFAAAADVEQWIALDRFDGRAWLERGNLAAHGGDLVGAMMAFEAAVVYAPGLVTAQLGLAMVYEQLGFRRRARAVWLRARDLTPDDAVKAQIDAHLR